MTVLGDHRIGPVEQFHRIFVGGLGQQIEEFHPFFGIDGAGFFGTSLLRVM